MSSDIVLTSALRNNLLSLQSTQRLIDQTQLRLATGLKVNSALDNPQSFFTAQTLNDRAGDLSRLLDSINLSIRTIEEANTGVESLRTLVDQAESVVNSARDELAASDGVARALGNVDLRDVGALVANTTIEANDEIDIVTTDDSGTQITQTVVILAGDTAETVAAKITNQFADNQNGEVTAEITDEGFFSIQSTDGRSFRLTTDTVAGGADLTVAKFAELGLGNLVESENDGAGVTTQVGATVVAGNTITSLSLYETAGATDLAESGDLLTGTYFDQDSTSVFSGFGVGDTIGFSIDDGSGTAITVTYTVTAGSTFQDLVNSINADTQAIPASDFIEANFDDATGTLSFTSVSDDVESFQIIIDDAGATGINTFNIGLGDPSGNLNALTATGAGNTADETFTFNNSSQALDDFAADYNEIRNQIDQLVQDASFRGVNLLNGDDLTTFFNEDNTNSLVTQGGNFTSGGLGLVEATFRNSDNIEATSTQVSNAQTSVRSFGNSIANDLAIVTARRNFTESTINTLRAGADDLTVADQNEEGANLLALQTRQALGTTSLSLASQSQQDVLRLF